VEAWGCAAEGLAGEWGSKGEAALVALRVSWGLGCRFARGFWWQVMG